ncbi:MAG TPA: NifU family protein [Alphaproteobacteria bacterium]|nr:NifU family protein [Alphaproteobacteria bacterium]HNS45498.1 NifU family protein [Alphaproteobacteria bacterium]
MFIHTETTPNPDTLKFLPGMTVTGGAGVEFKSPKEVDGRSPLALRLFEVDGVISVFFGEDFVSITKSKDEDWTAVKTLVLGVLFEHFSMKHPVLLSPLPQLSKTYSGEEGEVVGKIRELLDTRVRPAVARDGGDIEFCEFDKGILWLRMRGACAGCPSSTMTLKMGIENMMRHYIPEVLEVRAVND